jgi:hypothetical protein
MDGRCLLGQRRRKQQVYMLPLRCNVDIYFHVMSSRNPLHLALSLYKTTQSMRDFYSFPRLPILRSVVQVLKVLKLYCQALRPIQIDWFTTKHL